MAGFPKEAAKNLAGVEFQVYLEERMVPTRFWTSRPVSPQAMQLSESTLPQAIQGFQACILTFGWGGCRHSSHHLGTKVKIDFQHTVSLGNRKKRKLYLPPGHSQQGGTVSNYSSPRVPAKDRRGLRLRWAYEHEMLVNKTLKNVQCCTLVPDSGVFLTERRDSNFGSINDQLNLCSKNAHRQRSKSAWSSY